MSKRHNNSPYNGSLTREQFLFHEMRTTARLMSEISCADEVLRIIIDDNLYQYPTEKSLKSVAKPCIERLKSLNDIYLIKAIANQPSEVSKQICLYAMMKHNRLVWDFMLTVIAEKYRVQDFTFTRQDMNSFFMRLQEQDDGVASWSDSTIEKIKSVLRKVLVDNDYLDNTKTDILNPTLISSVLENAIRSNNDEIVLPAFNCFS